MTQYLLDTNVLSEFMRREPNAKVSQWMDEKANHALFISVITAGEILQGITSITDMPRKSHLLDAWKQRLHPWFSGRILPVTETIAEAWGQFSGIRKLQGKPLSMGDGLIAAIAAVHDSILVTRNEKDFQGLNIAMVNLWNI